MEKRVTSTVAFRSNLQPVEKSACIDDIKFLLHVRDPFALEILQKDGRYGFTPIQQREFEKASIHCTYALPGDYPFGTIVDGRGVERVICKCINTKCRLFHKCRPDFLEDELSVLEENIVFCNKVDETEAFIRPVVQSKEDIEAVLRIHAIQDENAEPDEVQTAEENIESDIDDVVSKLRYEVSEIQKGGKKNDSELPDATFASFVSVDQTDIIELDTQARCIINAGPGTGKTYTLIEKIKYMLKYAEILGENILVLCFSKAAVEVIRSRLEMAAESGELTMDWHMVEVRTFDSFATYMLTWLQENIPDALPDNFLLEAKNYDERIRMAADIFVRYTDMLASYEHLIIDEVQDLVGIRAEMVLAMLNSLPETCGFTLLGDSCQALFDYLAANDASVMSSDKFYRRLFHDFRGALFYALEENHRQGAELRYATDSYRKAIIMGDSEKCVEAARELAARIRYADLKIQHFNQDDAKRYTKKGSLGILTRTNGQALQISSWLRTEMVEHTLQQSSGMPELSEWISRIIFKAESDVMDFYEFRSIFSELYPSVSADPEKYWEAIVNTQIDQTKVYYEIEDLLKGLLRNAGNSLLYGLPTSSQERITVSNIHRAKGREFDAVLVLEDVIDSVADEQNEDDIEHKVCYVALTRPRKRIEKLSFKNQPVFISKDKMRRCFRAGGFANKKYLSHYEMGYSTDWNVKSFAYNEEIQKYIRENLKIGSRLKLLKCPENTKSYVIYRLVPEEDEHVVLGYTSAEFAFGMERAIQRIFNNYNRIAYKYFPNIFGDVYLNSRATCISAVSSDLPGARQYGSMYVWNGLEISGFAQIEKDRY